MREQAETFADCVLNSSPLMTNEQCRMIEITLADGKG